VRGSGGGKVGAGTCVPTWGSSSKHQGSSPWTCATVCVREQTLNFAELQRLALEGVGEASLF